MNIKRLILKALSICLIVNILLSFQFVNVSANNSAETENPFYLIDENFSFFGKSNLPSGWDVKAAGGELVCKYSQYFQIIDKSTVLPIVMKNKFKTQTSGNLTLEYRFNFDSLMDIEWTLFSDKTSAVSISISDESMFLNSKQLKKTLVSDLEKGKEYGVKAIIDIDNNLTDIYINGVLMASKVPFMNSVDSLNSFEVKTKDKDVGSIKLWYVKLYKNYIVNERLLQTVNGYFPQDWTPTGSGGTVTSEMMKSATNPDIYSFKLNDINNNDNVGVSKSFEPQNKPLVFEYSMYMPKRINGIKAEIKSGDNTVFSIATDGDRIGYVSADGSVTPVYDYIDNMWYRIKVKFNLDMKTATVDINGKIKATDVPVLSSLVGTDRISFSTSKIGVGETWIDDILIYDNVPLPDDYVEAPVKSKDDQYLVGIQNCSLWRNGYHNGWDVINATPERKSYLGFYDEGSSEVADWEIKWLVEHGIDYQLYCWFRPVGSEGRPIKTPYTDYALQDGYFNAEYSNSMQFAIMWECSSSRAKDSEDFRNNIIPFWMEYYFKDPRYLKINNKPVISLYAMNGLKNSFKDVAGIRAETDYLRKACKDAGFDGAIILASSSSSDPKVLQELVDAGMDTLYAYNWGPSAAGYIENQKRAIEKQQAAGVISKMCTFQMGYDDSAWFGSGGRYLMPNEFKQIMEWGRDQIMPSFDANSETKNMVMLGNWNEFGEGHFIMPAELHGFGYLDAIQDVFGGGGTHDNVRPNDEQLDRISNLYMKDRIVPLNETNKPKAIPTIIAKEWKFDTTGDKEGWEAVKQVDNLEVRDGKISGVSNGNDPGIISADNLAIDISYISYVKVGLKNETDSSVATIYFITDNDKEWAENKSVKLTVDANSTEFKDYYFPVETNKLWTGTLKQIRIDPTSSTGAFAIDSITFLTTESPGAIKVKLDNVAQIFKDSPRLVNGRTMVPMREIFEKMGAKVEWDEDTKTVTAFKDNNAIFLRVGFNKAISQNKVIRLDQHPVIIDDKVFVPLRFLCDAIGAKVEWDEKTQAVLITSSTKGSGSSVVESNVGRLVWDFNVADNLSGWAPNQYMKDAVVKDGILSLVSLGTDPFIMSADGLNLDAKNIKSFNVKLRNNTPGTSMTLYFITTEDTAWDESKTLSAEIRPNDNGMREYVLDTSKSEKWKDTIKKIRFDMTNKEGTVDIDYIKFITK